MIVAAVLGWVLAGVGFGVAMRARRRLRDRMEAVARACHEVRGPLTTIGLGLSLAGGAGGLSVARLRAIETELARAALAVSDLGDDRGQAPTSEGVTPVSMAELLADVVAAADGRARAAGVALRGDWSGPDAIVWGERLRLAQALANIVANAIEHGGAAIRVRGAIHHGGQARVEVVDGGPGLPASVAQLAARPRAGRGARGRGLAIATTVARRHGGQVTTAPAPRGARVVLTLPVSPTPVSKRV